MILGPGILISIRKLHCFNHIEIGDIVSFRECNYGDYCNHQITGGNSMFAILL